MAMTQQEFDQLVARLEHDADRNPGLYKLRLGAFASLGYLYIFGVLALLIAAVAGLGYVAITEGSGNSLLIKLAIPVVALIGIVLKALRVTFDAPRGFEMKRQERPRLFAAIEEVRVAAGAPKVDTVLLTDDLNAAIVQLPRLGLLGWHRNYLILGLPLMQLLTLPEFKAVLAHEFGHLSGAHGRFGAWIYRVRASWARINERLQQQKHWARFLFVPFFSWFAPKFSAWSFVQARAQEYEADNLAAETVGAVPLANALIRLNLKGHELEQHYWPEIYAGAAKSREPTGSPFTGLSASERRGFLPDVTDQLRQLLKAETDTTDTHPCLRQRIESLGQPAKLPATFSSSAAEALFGGALPFITDNFDEEWRTRVAQWWRERHEHIVGGRRQLDEFSQRPQESLSDEELLTYARLTEELASPEKAYPLYYSLATRPSKPIGARYAVGRLLLRKSDERGKTLLDAIMAEAPGATVSCCEMIIPYLKSEGREEEASAYIERYWQARNQVATAA